MKIFGDVHEDTSRDVRVCYGCVAMPGLVKLGGSRKRGQGQCIYSDDALARLRRPEESRWGFSSGLEVYD
jgi:hypothetical protein